MNEPLFELRWLAPHAGALEAKRLQYRTARINTTRWPDGVVDEELIWSAWKDVPYEMENKGW